MSQIRTESLPDGRTMRLFTLTSPDGLELEVADLGATVVRLAPFDDDTDVVLGHRDPAGYLTTDDNPYFGATVGRVANRIAGATFEIDGTRFRLSANEGANCLHGGADGFNRRTWTVQEHTSDRLTLTLVSPDGDQGFPGTVTTTVTYTVQGRSVTLSMQATTDAPTVVAMTNHSYFNLAGEGSGSGDDHRLTVDADEYLPVDDDSIPLGRRDPVQGTPFDLRSGARLGDAARTAHPQVLLAVGLDHALVLRGSGLRHAARLEHPATGRVMDLHTDAPALQVYTANSLSGADVGTSGSVYRPGDGIALEAEDFPDAPNQPTFPSITLEPGKTYRRTIRWEFSG